jgi:hypothetical protein
MKYVKPGITFGIIGGFLTFLFGGWSVAVLGSFLGLSLGLSLAGKFERKDPLKIAIAVLPAAVVSAIILLIFSLIQNTVIVEALGKRPAPASVAINANVLAFIGVVFLATLMACSQC